MLFIFLVGKKRGPTFASRCEKDVADQFLRYRLKSASGLILQKERGLKFFENYFSKNLVITKSCLPLHPASKGGKGNKFFKLFRSLYRSGFQQI
jgi:hypothetical protein